MEMVVKTHLKAMNLGPRNLASLRSIGTFMTAQVLSIITILDILAPFRRSVLHTGKAAYIGPAEKLPKRKEYMAPLKPELLPKFLSIAALGTQAFMRRSRSQMTGIIISISFT